MSCHNPRNSRAPRRQINWQQGDIAFLKHFDTYSPKNYTDLIASGYLAKSATVHPVILLAVLNDKAIITPVSAFRTEEQGFLAPWEQKWHRSKKRDHFRNFEGSKRPNSGHAALRLADSSMKMPKPQASWVYTESFVCVPFSVLGWFNKSPTLLRVHPDSVRQLVLDMKRNFPQQYNDAGARLNGSSATCISTIARTIARTQPPPKSSTPLASKFAQVAHRSGATRSQHLLSRIPSIRVAS